MTFDYVYVLAKDYPQAASDIRAFLALNTFNPDHVNHWPWLADFFEDRQEEKASTCPAIGFQWTSVSDDIWSPPYLVDEDGEEIMDEDDERIEDFASFPWVKSRSLYK